MRRQPRRAAHDGGQQFEQGGIGLEQREELNAGRQVAEEEIEVQQRLVGGGRAAQFLEQPRHQFGEQLSGASGRGRAKAAVVPASHDAGRGGRIAEAQRLEGLQRARIVVGAGEDQVAAGSCEARCLLEEIGIVAFHETKRLEQRVLKGARGVVAQEGRERGHAGLVGRDGMRLAVVDHLQAMLDTAQKTVGFGQLVGGFRGDVTGGGQCLERVAGDAAPQRGIAAAEDELLGLGEELDLADAATTELHIVAEDLDRAAAAMGVDLALDRMDVVDRREIEMLAPDVGRHVRNEGRPDGFVAGNGVRLDHGGALPVLADALVVEFRGLDRHRQWGRARIRAEPEIGAEDVAVGRRLRHELNQQAGRPHEVARQLLVSGQGRGVAVVEEDEVDVARVVEFAGPQLAHAQHGEGCRLRVAAERELPVAFELEQDGIGEGAQAPGREIAQFARDAVERPGIGNVGDCNAERHAPLEAPEPDGDVVGRGAGRRVRLHRGNLGREVRHHGVGSATP